eukprot:7308843-Prorocentrum_lima.AAC.1
MPRATLCRESWTWHGEKASSSTRMAGRHSGAIVAVTSTPSPNAWQGSFMALPTLPAFSRLGMDIP